MSAGRPPRGNVPHEEHPVAEEIAEARAQGRRDGLEEAMRVVDATVDALAGRDFHKDVAKAFATRLLRHVHESLVRRRAGGVE